MHFCSADGSFHAKSTRPSQLSSQNCLKKIWSVCLSLSWNCQILQMYLKNWLSYASSKWCGVGGNLPLISRHVKKYHIHSGITQELEHGVLIHWLCSESYFIEPIVVSLYGVWKCQLKKHDSIFLRVGRGIQGTKLVLRIKTLYIYIPHKILFTVAAQSDG